jgi:hypothetical protein
MAINDVAGAGRGKQLARPLVIVGRKRASIHTREEACDRNLLAAVAPDLRNDGSARTHRRPSLLKHAQ